MPSRIAVNGAALNGSAISRLLAAGVLAAAASASASGTLVHPATASLSGAGTLESVPQQQRFAAATGSAQALITAPNAVHTYGGAAAVASSTFEGTVAPAYGGATIPGTAAFSASANRAAHGTAASTSTGALSATAYGWAYPSSALTARATMIADPGTIVDGLTTFNASGAFGSGGTVSFTVTGVRIMAINASLGSIAGVLVANPTYKYRAASNFSAAATVAPSAQQTHVVTAAGVSSAAFANAFKYYSRATANINGSAALTTSGVSSLLAAAAPVGTAAMLAAGTTKIFPGYVNAVGLASVSALAWQAASAVAFFNCAGAATFSAESDLRSPDAIEILRPAEDREFIRAPEAREFMRTAT